MYVYDIRCREGLTHTLSGPYYHIFVRQQVHARVSVQRDLVIKSIRHDKWSKKEVEMVIELGGNSQVVMILERHLPSTWKKPTVDSTDAVRIYIGLCFDCV